MPFFRIATRSARGVVDFERLEEPAMIDFLLAPVGYISFVMKRFKILQGNLVESSSQIVSMTYVVSWNSCFEITYRRPEK